MKLNKYNLSVNQEVYCCGLELHRAGRIYANVPPTKMIYNGSKFETEKGKKYSGTYFEVFDNLEECQLAYNRLIKDTTEFCQKQIESFQQTILKLNNEITY